MRNAAVLLCASLLIVGAVAQDACTEENGPVVCTQCAAGADSNIIHGLPRWGGVSSNLGDLTDSWEPIGQGCLGEGGTCEAFKTDNIGGGSAKTLEAYVVSVGAYIGVAIFLAFISAMGFICCCFGRYCCRCKCCPMGNKGAGCCGGRYPTQKGKSGCCSSLLGFTVTNRATGELGYSKKEIWGTRIFMWIYCFCIVLFVSLGQFRGNEGVTTAMKAWAESPQGVVELAKGTVVPMGDFVQGMASGPLANFFIDFIGVLEPVDMQRILDSIDCIDEKLSNPPNLGRILEFLDDMDDTFVNLNETILSINDELDIIVEQKEAIAAAGDKLKGHIDNVTFKIDWVQDSLWITDNAITDLENFLADLTNDDDGVPSITADLAAMDGAPDAAEVDPATSGTDSLVSFPAAPEGGTGNGGEDPAVLLGKLEGLQTSYDALPNYTDTAVRMELFNQRIDDGNRDRITLRFEEGINATRASMATLDGTASGLNETIKELLATVDQLDLNRLADAILRIDEILNNVTFAPLIEETGKIGEIREVIPCMLAMAEEVSNLNETLMELPPAMNIITTMAEVINASLADADAAQQTVIKAEADFRNQTKSLGIVNMTRDIRRTQEDVTNATGSLNTAELLADIEEMESTDLNFTVIPKVRKLNRTLQRSYMGDDTISSLKLFEDSKLSMLELLDGIVIDLAATEAEGTQNWFCASDGTTSCTEDADCDAVDGAGEGRCRVDATRYGALAGALDATAANKPDVSDAASDMAAVGEDAAFDTNDLKASLTSANNSMAAVDGDALKDDVDSVMSGMDGFDIEASRGSFADINANLADTRKTLADQRGSIEALNATQADQQSQLTLLQDARALVAMLHGLLTDYLPNEILPRLTDEELDAVRDEDGIGGLLLVVTNALDDVTAYFANGAESLFGDGLATNLTDSVNGILDSIDVIDNPKYSENGPLYFIMALQDKDKLVTPEQGAGGRIAVDANGDPYPDGKECYTRECVNNFIDFANSAPLGDVMEEQSGSNAGIPVSRTNAMGLYYIMPILAMLLGFIASICFCSGWCGACCARLSCCCIACQMPCLFGFMGSFFVFALVMGDFCYGYENAGYRVLAAGDTAACEFLPDGQGNFEECSLAMDTGVANISVTMNMGDVYKGIFGGHCASEPLQGAWASMGESFGDVPRDMVNDMVDDVLTKQFGAREPLKNTLRNFGGGVGDEAEEFIVGVGKALGCRAMNKAYMGFKNALCCETLNAFYWGFASWYLIAFSYLLCGCTASCMGIKRFRGKLWGAQYKAAAEELSPAVPDGTGVEMAGWTGGEATAGTEVPYDPAYGDPYAAQGAAAGGYGNEYDTHKNV